jgi:hypothetical protein
MPVDVSGTLRQALSKLEAEKARIERQIDGLRQVLRGGGASLVDNSGSVARASRKRGRKRMSPAERKAVSTRMKAFWAKRRRALGKKSGAKTK